MDGISHKIEDCTGLTIQYNQIIVQKYVIIIEGNNPNFFVFRENLEEKVNEVMKALLVLLD